MKVSRPASASRRIGASRHTADTELGRLLDLLDRAWEGPSWHGPSVREALAGVTAAEAAAHPIAASHSIGELVLHMATWKRAVAHRLGGRPYAPGGAVVFRQAHGAIHHDLWHAGQILVLRRALEGGIPGGKR